MDDVILETQVFEEKSLHGRVNWRLKIVLVGGLDKDTCDPFEVVVMAYLRNQKETWLTAMSVKLVTYGAWRFFGRLHLCR